MDTDTSILPGIKRQITLQRSKTFLALLLLIFGWVINIITLAWVHDRVPRNYEPLPDLFFSIFPEIPETIRITEFIMLFMVINALGVIYFHQHRWIVGRRVFLCIAISYIFRAICICLLQVPVPSKNTYCAPQEISSFSVVSRRVITTFWSAGIEFLRPRILCGDLLVSGHTICLFTALYTFKHYAPQKLRVLNILYRIMALIAIICILFARKHYSIDVFLGYIVATNVFRIYHSLMYSFHQNEMDKNLLSQNILSGMVAYFEKDALPPYLFANIFEVPSLINDKYFSKFCGYKKELRNLDI
ncbi:Sphingomyelin synthase-like domain-containing protein [Strongyloides ratti]|uniref:Sphingomyelin synthase-like domain-containing protein n=1 Tax=Strongyloides ratti TaxID=34506 RepID=A0A090LM69_STRRB|nr:Sphingomyelin synthase-like domain-containing protein [Strongyloides ratti]CEF70821.1 Sphingomyelin synthase-like domain-containing protein [Strongyloides ratti]